MDSRLYQLLFLLLFSIPSIAQVQFSNRNDLLADRNIHSGVPVAIADMNGDGLDDIVAMDRGTELSIQYQTPDANRPFVRYALPVNVDIDVQNNITIADFNNDGANDIFTIGTHDSVKILYNIPYSYKLDYTTSFVIPFFSQGASAGDFNGDGWVDMVVLNDNGLNYTLLNNGAGHLAPGVLFDFVTVPPSDNSGNYGCLYTDFDLDGDVDFYIAKCRQGVNSPADPRRINVLFVNDGNNNYTEDAKNYGLASGRQSWTADFGDIDNDGDQDVFITQHDVISELFENIDNDTFINITGTSGLNIGGIPLQGMFRDFDNDGFQDILVSGDRIDYYHNNGDKTFTKQTPFGDIVFGTYAVGDLNNDGFTDVYASRVIPFNNPDLLREDILFLNEPNGNHYLSLNLDNNEFNPSAIGAMAILYGAWGVQVREVRGGEQYGISNSHKLIFGLGEEISYDSLVIRWPDGYAEFYNDLETDQTWNIQRGGCYSKPEKIWDPLDVICENDSIILKIDSETNDVQWSTGSNLDSIIIKMEGLYFVESTDEKNCPARTVPVEIIIDPDTIKPVIQYVSNVQLCNGDFVTLSLPYGLNYHWNSGQTEQTIEVTETGAYHAEVQGYCKVLYSDTIMLEFNTPITPLTEQDTFSIGEPATLVAHGDSILWFSDSLGSVNIGSGPVLVLNDLTESTTVYASNLELFQGINYEVGPKQQQGFPRYNATFINGGLLFDVLSPIIIEEFTVFTDSAGPRTIEIFDNADFFYEREVYIDSGVNVVVLDVELPAGSYRISTNIDMNNLVFGVNSPYLWRSDENILYPYEIEQVISITESTLGEDFYYYFYDWKIKTQDRYCSSDLVPVTAVLDTEVSTQDQTLNAKVLIYPNPTSDLIRIKIPLAFSGKFEILDLSGKVLVTYTHGHENDFAISLAHLPAGIYILKFRSNNQSVTKKVIRL